MRVAVVTDGFLTFLHPSS